MAVTRCSALGRCRKGFCLILDLAAGSAGSPTASTPQPRTGRERAASGPHVFEDGCEDGLPGGRVITGWGGHCQSSLSFWK